MTKFLLGALVLILFLAYTFFVPTVDCTMYWVDSNRNPINGEFYECNHGFKTRSIGFLEYTKIGNDVYRVSKVHGGTLPSWGISTRISQILVLIKLDGPVDWENLQGYFGGLYLSDGKIILNLDGKQVLSLTPSLAIKNLRRVPGSAAGSRYTAQYATDGYWVILDDNLVKGADAPTFRQIFPLELSGSQKESQTYMHFGSDKNFVYYLNEKLEDADPDSFGLLSYNECRNPPEGIQFNSNQVQLGAGWIAIDREQAWEVTFTGIIPLTTTEAELHVLQGDFKRAAAASKITSRGDFDESKCRR